MTRQKFARYRFDGAIHHGIVDESATRLLRIADAPLLTAPVTTGDIDRLADVDLLTPIPLPRVFGLGYNYVAHSQESGKASPDIPVLFMKPSTSVSGPGDAIVFPPDGEIVHFEGELCAVIGRGGRHIRKEDALDHVFGYTCGNDVSDRVLQRKESAFGCLLAGKGYDTFAPLGPYLVTGLDPFDTDVVTRVNGEVRQHGNTKNLLFPIPDIVAYLSRYITLLPGDVIMTGTPAGVGPIQPGDVIEVEVPGIGVLRNPVVAAHA